MCSFSSCIDRILLYSSKTTQDSFFRVALAYILGNCVIYAVFIGLGASTVIYWATERGSTFVTVSLCLDGALNLVTALVLGVLGGFRYVILRRITVTNDSVLQRIKRVRLSLSLGARGVVCDANGCRWGGLSLSIHPCWLCGLH